MRGRLLLLNGGVLALYVGGAAVLWPRVPGRIPMHFGLTGAPTVWVDATPLAWFGLPALAAGVGLLLWCAVRLAERAPSLWNVPRKERLLQLSDQERAPLEAALEAYMGRVMLGVTVLFMCGHAFIFTTATGRTTGLPWLFNIAVLALIAAMVADGMTLSRRLDRHLAKAPSPDRPPL